MTTEIAKQRLKVEGFQTYNLWHVNDAQHLFNCSEEQAMELLEATLSSESVISYIWEALEEMGEAMNLEKKEQ